MWKRLLILPPLAVGLAVLVFAVQNRPPLERAPVSEPARKVRVVQVPRTDFVPAVTTLGTVESERTWNAVAQVQGRIVEFHPRLQDGAIVTEGERLLRIDQTEFELLLAQSEAELAQLRATESNLRAALAIAQQNLVITESELERQERLLTRGTVSQRDRDNALNAVLSARQAVQTQETNLAVQPAQQRLARARIAQARLDLANAVITAPFDMRVEAVQAERSQYVSVGEILFRGDYIGRVEIETPVTLSQMRALLIGRELPRLNAATLAAANVPQLLGLEARVRHGEGGLQAEWPATVVRVRTVDPGTRTIGVVVAVDGPYDNVIPGVRPPLIAGMFVRVLLSGAAQPARVVVPRGAVRNGAVYLSDGDNRLRRREVTVLYSLGEFSVIGAGLDGGETLVVSDLVPAIDGTLLEPITDTRLAEELGRAGESSG